MSIRMLIWSFLIIAVGLVAAAVFSGNTHLVGIGVGIAILIVPVAIIAALVSSIRWILTGRTDGTLASSQQRTESPRRLDGELMDFTVRGADRKTGQMTSMRVRAASAREAADEAADCGILVSDILRNRSDR